MSVNNSVSVIIPVYNSESVLKKSIQRLQPVLTSIASQYEVILVNDGSRDQSWAIICELSKQYDWIRGIDLMRNYGQHNALLCGIRAARHEIIITIDDDLQNPPEEIPALLEKLDEGYDVVYGYPQKEQHGIGRDVASRIMKLVLQNAMGAETAGHASSFRVIRTRICYAFSKYQSPFVSIDVLLTWGSRRFAAIPVRHDPRLFGVSNYTFRKLVSLALTMVTGFSTLPLQFASFIGFAFSIMGEYLSRMHYRMMEQPAYVISQTIENNSPLKNFKSDLSSQEGNPVVIQQAPQEMIVDQREKSNR
jgi:glycosyltransferase involved in cell wall biosynthesis